MAVPPEFTDDTLFDGRLSCRQHRGGYRFSVDAVLLPHFIRPVPGDRILDLGAGSGIVSLILAYRWPRCMVVALELQPALYSLLGHNVATNGFQDRIRPVAGDLRQPEEVLEAGSFSWVLSNPPYRRAGAGRLNPGGEQAAARHELAADLPAVVRAAAYGVKNRGRVVFVYPAGRAATLMSVLRSSSLEPKRLQPIYGYPGGEARLVLVEALKNGGEGLRILPPCHIYRRQGGEYSPEVARLYEP